MGRVISLIVEGSTFITNDGLNCITYKDERDEPPAIVEDIFIDLPTGHMPWNPELIDKWCKSSKNGTRQSDTIQNTIKGLIEQRDTTEGENLFLVLTHTQQLAEVLRLRGRLENPSMRFPELTMVILGDKGCFILNQGIFSPKEVMEDKI